MSIHDDFSRSKRHILGLKVPEERGINNFLNLLAESVKSDPI
jgi:hypothetical protein